MQYLFLIRSETPETDADADVDLGPVTAWVDEMDARGARLVGNRLRPATDATTVRVSAGDVLVTDGPFAEAAEHIGGFDVIEAADLDEAVAIASKHPAASDGGIEIRPVWV